jgi:Ca2+-binding EF-hand superfamily protein
MSKSKAGYTPGETAALKGLFDMFDKDGRGFIATSDLEEILEKVGRDPVEGTTITVFMYMCVNTHNICMDR